MSQRRTIGWLLQASFWFLVWLPLPSEQKEKAAISAASCGCADRYLVSRDGLSHFGLGFRRMIPVFVVPVAIAVRLQQSIKR